MMLLMIFWLLLMSLWSCAVASPGPDFNDPIWSRYSPQCRDFIAKMLVRDPAKRITAADARTHPWLVGL